MPPGRIAVLLRGVNLGGRNRVPMADFRRILDQLGCTGVATYLQSGNAVVTAALEPQQLSQDVRRELRVQLGIDVPVLVRTGSELAEVVRGNPYPEAVAEPAKLHVVFLDRQPTSGELARFDSGAYAPDEATVGQDRAVYLRYATSPGRSRLSAAAIERLGVVGTARNWRTVEALAGLTG